MPVLLRGLAEDPFRSSYSQQQARYLVLELVRSMDTAHFRPSVCLQMNISFAFHPGKRL